MKFFKYIEAVEYFGMDKRTFDSCVLPMLSRISRRGWSLLQLDAAADGLRRGEHILPEAQLALLRPLLHYTKKNAKARGIQFNLSMSELAYVYRRNNGCCALTGIPFSWDKGPWLRRPWAPSIDRIDNAKGYTRTNVRIVCGAVNFAMNEWGEDVLRKIAEGLLRQCRLPI